MGRVNLGLSLEETLSLQPWQLFGFIDQRESLDIPKGRNIELLLAQLGSLVVNWSARAPKKPVQPEGYMLRRAHPSKASPKKMRRSARDIARECREIMSAHRR